MRKHGLGLGLSLLLERLVSLDGFPHEEKEHRTDSVERRYGPEENVLQLEAPLLDQITHQRGCQRPKRRQSAGFRNFGRKRKCRGLKRAAGRTKETLAPRQSQKPTITTGRLTKQDCWFWKRKTVQFVHYSKVKIQLTIPSLLLLSAKVTVVFRADRPYKYFVGHRLQLATSPHSLRDNLNEQIFNTSICCDIVGPRARTGDGGAHLKTPWPTPRTLGGSPSWSIVTVPPNQHSAAIYSASRKASDT